MAPNRSKPPQTTAKVTERFADVSAIQAALKAQSPDVLSRGLTVLRNQFTVKGQELVIPPQDERILLSKSWLEVSPGVKELFGLWDSLHQHQPTQVSLVLSILSNLLQLCSFHSTDYALGHPVVKSLLTAPLLRRLSSYIGGSNNELILVTLKLYNCMSNFARGRERKSVLEHFPWDLKSLPKLFNLRRHGSDDADPLIRPDIRTLYVLFLLSFVEPGTATVLKAIFFEQHRDAFLAIFKGINKDHRVLVRKILEVCWAGLWMDPKLKRTVKIGLFGEVTIGHLTKLYERTAVEGDDQEQIPADLIHHFLLAICTRPGTGVCFKDQAWYPKEAEDEEIDVKDSEHQRKRTGRIYNKILANVLKTLKVNEDSRQQELALRILGACPELVAGYWPTATLTLEPRLSSKWITNIAFFGTVISLPVPSSSFRIADSSLHHPIPPPLSTIMESILPSVNTKFNFTKGLQSPSPLVQHCTALALSKCLLKYEAVVREFDQISRALEEDEDDGQWIKRRKDVEREAGRKVPEFQVIIAFSQQKHELSGTDPQSPSSPNAMKGALLAESAQRLLWLYHHCLPSVVASVRFDAGKALQTFSAVTSSDEASSITRLRHVQQLHTLNLLRESDQFVWTSKTGSGATTTPLYILLQTISQTSLPAIQWTATTLLQHVLSNTILFQDDVEEPYLWLSTLPRIHSPETDDAMEVDNEPTSAHQEGVAVIAFLEDSIQRCLKTPYRYIEDLQNFVASCASASSSQSSQAIASRVSHMPSALIMTVLEQLQAKVAGKHLSPVQVLGVVSYLRRTLYKLAAKVADLSILLALRRKLEEAINASWQFETAGPTYEAVKQELKDLAVEISFAPPRSQRGHGTQKGKNVDFSMSNDPPEAFGDHFVDWIRSNPHPRPSSLKPIFELCLNTAPRDLNTLLQYAPPGSLELWEILTPTSAPLWLQHVDFFVDSSVQEVLSRSASTSRRPKSAIVHALNLVIHAISVNRTNEEFSQNHLRLLARIFSVAKEALSSADYSLLQETYLGSSGPLRDLLLDPGSVVHAAGIIHLLESSIDFTKQSERTFVSDISQHWLNALGDVEPDHLLSTIAFIRVWLPYLPVSDLLSLLKMLGDKTVSIPSESNTQLCDTTLQTFYTLSLSEPSSKRQLQANMSLLLSLLPQLPTSTSLREILAIGVQQYVPVGLSGLPLSTSRLDVPKLSSIIKEASERWPKRSRPARPTLDTSLFIQNGPLPESNVAILTALAYVQPSSRDVLRDWLKTMDPGTQNDEDIVKILDSLLDASSDAPGSSLPGDVEYGKLLPAILSVVSSHGATEVARVQARRCLVHLASSATSGSGDIVNSIASGLKNTRSENVTSELLAVGVDIAKLDRKAVKPVLDPLLEMGLQWFIDEHSSQQENAEVAKVVQVLKDLVTQAPIPKPHLVETVLTVVTQHQLGNVSAVGFATACVETTPLKPVVINRFIQNIVQNPHFFKICNHSSTDRIASRDALLRFVYALFLTHPSNTCQVTHVEPLIRVYHGSTSKSDLAILDIYRLFEEHRRISTTAIIARWSATAGTTSETALEALRSLDPTLVLRTSLAFPSNRTLSNHSSFIPISRGDPTYDPVFVMLLFSVALQDGAPTTNFAWVELFRTNVVGMTIRALSSKDDEVRELALGLIAGLWSYLENADLHEKPHVTYLLQILKNLIHDHTAKVPRLPSYTTLLLMHALRGIFYPSHFTYPLTARFLLQRPELDTSDVPMLYGMLYSSSDDWKKERTWMIRFLSDGMLSGADWKVLKRRHTWDLLASLYTSSSTEEPLRHSILEVLANLTSHPYAASSLVLKSALLPWIEIQLTQSTGDSLAWLKILENVIVVVEPERIEKSTSGAWRSVMWRCLALVLKDARIDAYMPHLATTMARLAKLGPIDNALLDQVLPQAFAALERYESAIDFVTSEDPANIPKAPHRSVDLFQQPPGPDFGLWCHCVKLLWTVCMELSSDAGLWSSLTQRLLIKHSNGVRGAVYDEAWIRKEIAMLSNQYI